MKHLLFLTICFFAFSTGSLAQTTETFDIAAFQPPKGWEKQVGADSVQFLTEDKASGTFCIITLTKSMPGLGKSKENFNAAWETIVKEAVNVTVAPTMQPANNPEDWKAEMGTAAFEKDGVKGAVVLITVSGHGKMMNLMILTNTEAYEPVVTAFIESISLKKPAVDSRPINEGSPADQVIRPQAARKSSFKFNTSNFDDGWISTEQEDWVEVVKGNIKVLIHYPKAGSIFPADPEPLTNAAWDILVAPRYSSLKNYKTSYISSYNRPYLGMGYAVERASGKQVFVLLFRQGDTGWLEFIAPDKNSFIQQYKFDPETIRWDSETELLKPLVQMVNYNKFAIAESDFNGTWTNDFTGVQQLYSVYTGNYAGMNIHQSNQEFVFGAGNSYRWELLVVSGMVGNTKYANVKSAGKFSVPNNWQIHFSKIESGPKTYNAHWSCIKGARLLKLLDANAPGSGIYTVYGKK
ncbi:MAG: hypothetical protein ACT4O9_13440 [Blastocatellia bacterium]